MTTEPTSLVDVLKWRAKNQPGRLAYRFLTDGEYEEVVITYEELDRQARSTGALLQNSLKAGDRALLLFPPGLDFIVAYFGCLYARVIAVPVYPPHPARIEKSIPAILRIVQDASPATALLTSSLFAVLNSQDSIKEKLNNIKLLVTDSSDIDDWNEKWQEPVIGNNVIAFLQYTSGSTTTPRGVMVSHGNLLHNLGSIEKSFGQSGESHAVIWLPPYHDMGLVGGILQPLYSGYPATLMSHLMFLQRPIRWLQAISRFRATTSGGPNFAYDLCVRKIKPEQRELIDLSSWEVAFNGAEPVYHKTLDQFAEFFASCGFRRDAFLPCYGLAESTLLVSGGPKSRPAIKKHLVNSELEKNKVFISPQGGDDTKTLVGCGQNLSGQKIRIVNAERLAPCQSDEVGEIWVSGSSVVNGYWNRPMESEVTFGAYLRDSGEGPFLRTGDLGFVFDGELYITGRIKNLIIVEGRNYYPHDIERTVEESHPLIRPASCAAFTINNSSVERLIIIVELEPKYIDKAEEIKKAIRTAISFNHDIQVNDIRLSAPGGIPRTTSGKIKHHLCKTNYMAGLLKETVLT